MSAPAHIARENGKKGGRPKGSKAVHTLQAEAGRQALIKAYLENIVPLNAALIAKALTGDVQAYKEIHDRVHGRPLQAVEMSGKDGATLFPETDINVEEIAKEVAVKLRERKT